MAADRNVLAMVLAGGEGTRLAPLTSVRSKPAVPFGARYRIVDFVLSNLVNSGIYSIYVLVQYRSQSLIEHIRNGWVLAPVLPNHFVTVVPPQMREGPEWFQGTADAIWQNLNLIKDSGAQLVAVFGADHIYRMDLRQMIDFHCDHHAHVTVAATPVPRKEASGFGIMGVDGDGRITSWVEKPKDPPAMPGRPDYSLASMGNYIFDAEFLIDALLSGRKNNEKDFGHHVIPRLIETRRAFSYDFSKNVVPGTKDYEEPGYWRDVGTLDAYFEANRDTLGLQPKLELANRQWPIRSSAYQGPPANILDAKIHNSHIGAGSRLGSCIIRNSVIRRDVTIEDGALVEDSIIMDYCVIRRGAKIRRAIIDRYNVIEANEVVGGDNFDSTRYHRTDTGLVVARMAEVLPGFD
ncbi:MAG TPA: glucose-1-phosphate adenylyltransferase [Burkholderiales bacterium]|jgi:glucose-1-phosphate adenylyltransferase|nr:glucose-1-phosphate adenylyltransferase [Burkholderiales bacterium]